MLVSASQLVPDCHVEHLLNVEMRFHYPQAFSWCIVPLQNALFLNCNARSSHTSASPLPCDSSSLPLCRFLTDTISDVTKPDFPSAGS